MYTEQDLLDLSVKLNKREPIVLCPCCGRRVRTPKVKEQPKQNERQRPEYTGIRADELPDVLTEDEFQAYLSIKREEKPNDPFFADESAIRVWLLSKGKVVLHPDTGATS